MDKAYTEMLTRLVMSLSHKRSGRWFFMMPVTDIHTSTAVPSVLVANCSIRAFCPDQGYFRSDIPFGENAWKTYGILILINPYTGDKMAVPISEVERVNPLFDWRWALQRSQRRADLAMQLEYELGMAQQKQAVAHRERVIKDVQAEVISKSPTFH